MTFFSETLSLSDRVFTILRDLIREQTGIYYADDKQTLLADKLSPFALERGFGSMLDYYYLLKYDAQAGDEWERVVDVLTVQETYFWRELDQIQALSDHLLPRLAKTYEGRPLRIWCAACASGEEPLSIAMMLDRAGWFDRLDIRIQASDISGAALRKAREGIYRERSFRRLPPELHERYFTVEQGGTWRIDAALHQRVEWHRANLVRERDVESLAAVPVIFCRNVFIYFTEATLRRVVECFARHMHEPGYLFIAAAESLFRVTDTFALGELNGVFVYHKAARRHE